MRRMQVLVVDDTPTVQLLLQVLIGLDDRFELAGTADNGDQAIAMAERLRPDGVILDYQMPGRDGLSALPDLLAATPETVVVMYSSGCEESLQLSALRLGAAAYMSKHHDAARVLDRLYEELQAKPATHHT